MSTDPWLKAHPYLAPLASLCARIDAAAAGLELAGPAIPDWSAHLADYQAGVPLLQSSAIALDLEPAGRWVVALLARLAQDPPPGRAGAEIRALAAELRAEGVVDWLLSGEGLAPCAPGMLRFLGWNGLARELAPLVEAFANWRVEERWMQRYCPTCGSPPAMSQLVGTDPGRRRLLACGCCRTRWRFARTRCPFCENDSQRLSVITFEAEPRLRLDHCESCRGYVKTYVGEGEEALLLSDWSSLHLDLVALDRGLGRRCASLFELEGTTQSLS